MGYEAMKKLFIIDKWIKKKRLKRHFQIQIFTDGQQFAAKNLYRLFILFSWLHLHFRLQPIQFWLCLIFGGLLHQSHIFPFLEHCRFSHIHNWIIQLCCKYLIKWLDLVLFDFWVGQMPCVFCTCTDRVCIVNINICDGPSCMFVHKNFNDDLSYLRCN